MKTLKNLITLNQNIKIYVPSTLNVNQEFDNKEVVEKTLIVLSQSFGGSTSYQAFGAWVTVGGNLVKEAITICQSFCTEQQLKENMELIYDYCLKLKLELNQESIALEINNALHLV